MQALLMFYINQACIKAANQAWAIKSLYRLEKCCEIEIAMQMEHCLRGV